MSIEALESRQVLSSADLMVAVAPQHPQFGLGSPVEFIVTVTNLGPDGAPAITLMDTLPSGVTPLISTPAGSSSTMSGNVATITGLGPLNSGASETVTIESLNHPALGTYTNSAVVSVAGATDLMLGNNTASASTTVITPSANLGVTLAPPAAVATNGKISFVATVSDAGPTAAANATLTDTLTLPAGATITAAINSQGGATSIAGNTVTTTFASIDTGTSASLTVLVTSTANGSFAESASVNSTTTPDPIAGNNSASLPATPVQVASFSLVPSKPVATLHQPVTLTATVSYLGGTVSPAGTVTFLDGATVLGTAKVNTAGVATLAVSTLPLGPDAISATYAGDPSYPAITTPTTASAYVVATPDDFDGDGKADLVTYGLIPNDKGLYGFTIRTSSSNFTKTIVWDNQGFGFGNSSSIPVIGDYFGDGKDAYAIWSPLGDGTMLFQAISSANAGKALSINFGTTADVPVVADVDGDGKDDFGVYGFYPTTGYRYDFLLSSRVTAATATAPAYPYGFNAKQRLIFNNYGFGYGIPGSSPVVGDFDGAGHAGLGVLQPGAPSDFFAYTSLAVPATGTAAAANVLNPPATDYFNRAVGLPGDVPIAVDYDGDGKADLALYGRDPATGLYRYDVVTSSSGFNTAKPVYFNNSNVYGFGYSATIPIMADYEGTGRADFAVFQPDGTGGASFIFQDVALGYVVAYDVARPTDLPADAPAYILARKVRGQ